jgi:hypothetical protein
MSEHQIIRTASPELSKFFRKLLVLKAHIAKIIEDTDDALLKDIYDRLNTIIKEKE